MQIKQKGRRLQMFQKCTDRKDNNNYQKKQKTQRMKGMQNLRRMQIIQSLQKKQSVQRLQSKQREHEQKTNGIERIV